MPESSEETTVAKIRWTGDGDREVAFVDDEGVRCEVAAARLEWVDVPPRVAAALAKQDEWEVDVKKQHAKDEGDVK